MVPDLVPSAHRIRADRPRLQYLSALDSAEKIDTDTEQETMAIPSYRVELTFRLLSRRCRYRHWMLVVRLATACSELVGAQRHNHLPELALQVEPIETGRQNTIVVFGESGLLRRHTYHILLAGARIALNNLLRYISAQASDPSVV
jgi:hypothetical protein